MPKKADKTSLETAIQYITYRMRSVAEVKRHLALRGFAQTEIEDTIFKLKEYGYLDDRQFAEELVRCKTARRPTGRRKLAQILYQSGVSDLDMELALQGYTPEDEQNACDEQFRKLMNIKGADKYAKAKIQRSLLQRGFSYEQISSSTKRFLDEDTYYIE